MNLRPWMGLSLFALTACHQRADPAARGEALRVTSAAQLIEPGIISTEYGEIRLAVSPDGALRLWGSPNRPGGPGGWDVWLSRRTLSGWSQAVPAPFNSPSNDFDPAFAPDGRWLYFFSNRPGGAGGDDLYRVALSAEGFGEVSRLGPEVNTAGDEWAPAPAPEGGGLLFARNVPGQRHDLYFAAARGDGFAQAELLPGEINTPDYDEFDATFLPGSDAVIFTRSANADSEPMALFLSRRGPNGYDRGVALPASINVAGGYTLGPSLDPQDPTALYFSGHRPEQSRGRLDLYRIHFRRP